MDAAPIKSRARAKKAGRKKVQSITEYMGYEYDAPCPDVHGLDGDGNLTKHTHRSPT